MATTLAPDAPDHGAPQQTPAPRARRLRDEVRPLRRTLVIFGVVILAVVAAIGVGLVWFAPATPLTVVGSDYHIAISPTLQAGSHKIAFENHGVQPHELLIIRTSLSAAELPVDSAGNVVEDAPQLHNVLDSGDGLRPGRTQQLAVTLTPGHYAVICNLPTHYRLGMRQDLTVTQ